MTEKNEGQNEPSRPHISEHLANERTFLAWLRTSFSVLTLGIATNRFSHFLAEMRAKSAEKAPTSLFGRTHTFGLEMVIFGTILLILTLWHYWHVKRMIDSHSFKTDSRMIWAVGAVAILFGFSVSFLLIQAE